MEPLRIGVIGCGVAGCTLHLPALARIRETELFALADSDPEALERAGEQFGVERRSSDYHDLLADPAVEAVCITAPTDLHTEIALAAIDAGKPFLVEKPLAVSVDECDLVIDRAAAAGVRGTVGFNLRWHRHVSRARSLIRQGALGEVRLMTSIYASEAVAGPLRSWRADHDRGGGVLALQAVHHFDFWRYLLDQEIEEVSSFVSNADGSDRVPVMATIAGTTAGGIGISSGFCGITGQENGFAVYGTEAWLRASLYTFDGLEMLPRAATVGDPGRHLRRPARLVAEIARALPNLRRRGDFSVSYQEEWRHFAEAIRSGGPLACTLEDGGEAVRIMAAVRESARTGSSVRVADAAPRLPA